MLNDQTIRAAKPVTHLWDSTLKGFGIRIGKKANTFVVLVESGRRKKIGRYPLVSLTEARSIARKLLAEKTLGWLAPKHTAFQDAVESFMADRSHLRPSTARLYRHHLRRFPFGRKSIADVTATDILRVLKPLTPSQKEHAFRIAGTFFTWCFRTHLIDRSPMERMTPPPLGKPRERVLSEDELKSVYTTALRLESNLDRLIWLLLRTGQRSGETRLLKWDYISPDRITLPGEITKNGRTHTFPISKQTYDTLRTFPELSEYVFTPSRSHVRGKPVAVFSANTNVRLPFYKDSKTSGWTLHDLRRTFATGLEELGVRTEVTERFLNHVSGKKAGIVGVYQRHNFFKEMQEALALWEAKLETLIA